MEGIKKHETKDHLLGRLSSSKSKLTSIGRALCPPKGKVRWCRWHTLARGKLSLKVYHAPPCSSACTMNMDGLHNYIQLGQTDQVPHAF